jgi:ribosomal protein S18 acetylase RimI-like enzyme
MIDIRAFTPADYDSVTRLWQQSEGVTLRDVDAREPLTAYLEQHRDLSFVAVDGDVIVGAVLCGTDGRRGYLQHLAVAMSHRSNGIGRELAERSVAALSARGVDKCHLMVVAENAGAKAFWSRLGWKDRDDIRLMSHTASGKPNA